MYNQILTESAPALTYHYNIDHRHPCESWDDGNYNDAEVNALIVESRHVAVREDILLLFIKEEEKMRGTHTSSLKHERLQAR